MCSCTVLHNIRMVLKQKIVSNPRSNSSVIYSSQGKTMILLGANNVCNWFIVFCPFSMALFYCSNAYVKAGFHSGK